MQYLIKRHQSHRLTHKNYILKTRDSIIKQFLIDIDEYDKVT